MYIDLCALPIQLVGKKKKKKGRVVRRTHTYRAHGSI